VSSPSFSLASSQASSEPPLAKIAAIVMGLGVVIACTLAVRLGAREATEPPSPAPAQPTAVPVQYATPSVPRPPAPVIARPAAGRPTPASERRVAEALFAGDYARASDSVDALAASRPEDERYAVMMRVVRAKAVAAARAGSR
jgi:hypothetical protein